MQPAATNCTVTMQQPARRACASLIANLRGSCWLQTSTAAPAVGYSSCLSSSEQPSTSGSAGRRAYSTDDGGSKPVESIGNEKVQALATQIMGLTVLEASWLSEILRKKLNIQKPAFGAMPMGMPVAMPAAPSTSAPAASAADAAPVEKKEKTEFEVKLASFTPEGKIKVIKEIRAITNLGLKEAKELVEKAPVTIKANVAKADAETMKKQIEAAGAKVELL